ncbi:DUF2087 domain-containing protein [Candidatus Soleaferrea massiliensis]|uniref:DUF2087 domain-containing protein n=1 Tax=Candidatus Soleaferrea massiliensis TaxID=1470354 RepID=UPI00058F37AD|nr:DUF2087 domain-containing protein [Candidatus Soleaferrea massiliensis]
MDYASVTLEELKKGYRYDEKTGAYLCNYCEQVFQLGQIFQMQGRFYEAGHAAARHIDMAHGGNLPQLLAADTRYNTITPHQKELLSLFDAGLSDKEMAKKLQVSEATIRRQRFTFREKAKQAKFYLAVYEQVFGGQGAPEAQMAPVHNHAVYVDDRYLTTQQEKRRIIETFFSSLDPLVLKSFSPKEKKKVVILGKIAEQFEHGRQYSEKEVNQILKPIFEDFATLRRYLIMYGFMERTRDGAAYWLAD